MLKDKKTTYGSIPKNNDITKLIAEIKQAIQKVEGQKKQDKKKLALEMKMIY